MSLTCLYIVTALYVAQALFCATNGQGAQALMLAGYIIANLGLVWSLL